MLQSRFRVGLLWIETRLLTRLPLLKQSSPKDAYLLDCATRNFAPYLNVECQLSISGRVVLLRLADSMSKNDNNMFQLTVSTPSGDERILLIHSTPPQHLNCSPVLLDCVVTFSGSVEQPNELFVELGTCSYGVS